MVEGGGFSEGWSRNAFLLSRTKKTKLNNMPLSSETLFHFTSKYEYLTSILTGAFFPRFSLETIESKNRDDGKLKTINKGVPMVCFCDIPLSQVKDHINFYGSYGIGLKKQWGQSKGLNPLIYLDKDSNLSDHIVDMSYEIFKPEFKNKPEFKKLKAAYHDIVRYTKPYTGQNINRKTGNLIENYNFYNEKEWRYVPKIDDHDAENIYLKKDQYDDFAYRTKQNKLMESKKITFKPNDISYIIVKEDYEVERIMECIEGLGHSYKDTKRLISKIQTNHQIMFDF